MNWGDGTPVQTFTQSTKGMIAPVSHTYSAAGTYTASVTVLDTTTGLSSSASFNTVVASVSVQSPIAQSTSLTPSVNSSLASTLTSASQPVNLEPPLIGPAPPHALDLIQSTQVPPSASAGLPARVEGGAAPDVTVISGKVFLDYNGNGVPDQGEPGLAGQIVYLESKEDGIFEHEKRHTFTDDKGEYEFRNVRPGVYQVRQVIRPYIRQTSPANNGGRVVIITKQQPMAINENFGALLVKPRNLRPIALEDVPADDSGDGSGGPGGQDESRLPGIPESIDTADNDQPFWKPCLITGAVIVPACLRFAPAQTFASARRELQESAKRARNDKQGN